MVKKQILKKTFANLSKKEKAIFNKIKKLPTSKKKALLVGLGTSLGLAGVAAITSLGLAAAPLILLEFVGVKKISKALAKRQFFTKKDFR